MIEQIKYHIQKNATLILRAFIFLTLIWLSIGYFPILNIEGDSALFSAGCERLSQGKLSLPPVYFYEWDMQPLVGFIVVSAKHLFPHFTCEQIYYVFTILCSLIYFFVAALFVSKLTKIRWEYCFFILLLFPESYSIGYYSNTTIFASLVSLLAFLIILKKPLNPISMLLLGIAPLLRVDVLAIYPVILLLFWRHLDLKKSLYYSVFYAIGVLVICSIGFWLLKANPLATLNEYNELLDHQSPSIDFKSFIMINAAFYLISMLILIFIGTSNLYKSKQYKLLFLCLLPIIILYIIYRDFSGAATKHIQYLLPFVSILVVYGLMVLKRQIVGKKYVTSFIILVLIIGQGFIGVRVFPNSKPWLTKIYSAQYPQPKIATLFSHSVKKVGKVEVVIGAGQIVSTADEYMLLSGNFFAPSYWYKLKKNELYERRILEKIITENKSDTLYFMTTQASDWSLSQHLHGIGFGIQGATADNLKGAFSSNFHFVRGSKTIIVNCAFLDRTTESFNNAFNTIKNRPLYFMAMWDWQLYLANEKQTDALPISQQISIIR